MTSIAFPRNLPQYDEPVQVKCRESVAAYWRSARTALDRGSTESFIAYLREAAQ